MFVCVKRPSAHVGSGEVAQQLRVCTALTGDLSLVPSTHAWLLTATYNSSSGRFETLFWALWVSSLSWHTNIDMHKYIR